MAHARRLPSHAGGALPVSRIASEVGRGQGCLVRRFTEQTGLAPKTTARVLRFHRAVGLPTRERAQPTEATAVCGFYDKAHLNREFRAPAGSTPGRMVAARVVGEPSPRERPGRIRPKSVGPRVDGLPAHGGSGTWVRATPRGWPGRR
ncbi:helix-turn-helix domain-containing protein [Streptomyces sp. NPDC091259]|uniref:helix-turn-helix domain-containing protein n=1 Tax=Streptomyces sp. NPDC091259 TaxID=3365976 RepID=UPI0037F5A882